MKKPTTQMHPLDGHICLSRCDFDVVVTPSTCTKSSYMDLKFARLVPKDFTKSELRVLKTKLEAKYK